MAVFMFHLRFAFRSKKAPTTPAAMPIPLMMATPRRPSLATLSSMSWRRSVAWRLAGSLSRRRSL